MSKIWMPGGAGGGAGSDECTLVKANVPTGLKAVTADSDDEAVEGTLDTETTLADSQALSGQTFLKFNPVTKLFERRVGGMTNRGAVIQELGAGGSYTIPEGFHNGSGKVTAKSLASQTPGDSAAGHILAGRTAWVNGSKITGTIPTQGAATITPGTSAKTAIAAGRYASGDITVAGSSTLVASNIKKGVTIFGVTGTFEGYVSDTLYFYNSGTWSNLSSTGVTKTTSGGSIVVSNNYIALQYTGESAMCRTNQTVDLTNYNYLKATFSSGMYSYLGIGTNPSSNTLNGLLKYIAINGSGGSGTAILDISSYTGYYYIYLRGGDAIVDSLLTKLYLSKT